MLDQHDQKLVELFNTSFSLAVIGLSPKPVRPSHRVALEMRKFGFKIIPVRPAVKEVLGEKAFASLIEIDAKIDIVNVFRTNLHVSDIVEQTIKIGAQCLWLQEGIQHPSASKAQDAGIHVVMNRCILKEYRRLSRHIIVKETSEVSE